MGPGAQGEVVSEREYKKRRLLYAKDYNNYWMELGHEYLDASRKSSLARFMNHSCMPNCCTVKWQARPAAPRSGFAQRLARAGLASGAAVPGGDGVNRRFGRARCHPSAP